MMQEQQSCMVPQYGPDDFDVEMDMGTEMNYYMAKVGVFDKVDLMVAEVLELEIEQIQCI